MLTADHLQEAQRQLDAALRALAAVLDGRPDGGRLLGSLWRCRSRLLEAADALALLAEDLDAAP